MEKNIANLLEPEIRKTMGARTTQIDREMHQPSQELDIELLDLAVDG